MIRPIHALLTCALLVLVVLVYLGGLTTLRPLYTALIRLRQRVNR